MASSNDDEETMLKIALITFKNCLSQQGVTTFVLFQLISEEKNFFKSIKK